MLPGELRAKPQEAPAADAQEGCPEGVPGTRVSGWSQTVSSAASGGEGGPRAARTALRASVDLLPLCLHPLSLPAYFQCWASQAQIPQTLCLRPPGMGDDGLLAAWRVIPTAGPGL